MMQLKKIILTVEKIIRGLNNLRFNKNQKKFEDINTNDNHGEFK